jgi:uncharacterized RDD family membrane protein YckC
MTQATRRPVCRCGARIRPVGANWQALDGERPGDFWCPDGSLHEPAPRSRVTAGIVTRLLAWAACLLLGCAVGAALGHAPLITVNIFAGVSLALFLTSAAFASRRRGQR